MIERDLVLLGGGHTHVLLIRALAMNPIPGVRVTLVSESGLTPYSGMLPGYVAGHYSLQQTQIDLNRLCRRSGTRWVRCKAIGIDLADQQLLLEGQAPLSYDRLSIDIGSTPDLRVPGAQRHALGVKPISGFQQRWDHLLKDVDQSSSNPENRLDWAVVGAGAGGVELVLAMSHRLRNTPRVNFHLVYSRFMPGYPRALANRVERKLFDRGINLHPDFRVREVRQDGLVDDDGELLKTSQSIWCTGASGASWLAQTGLAVTGSGFIPVLPSLRAEADENVFAVGDIAHMSASPRPKAGVYAVRQAPLLEANLRRDFAGQALQPVKLQSEFLSMIALGEREAVASRNGLVVSGAWVWRWKDRIDQRFMRQFSDMEHMGMSSMPPEATTSAGTPPMPCGGCGSKLGPELLRENLLRIRSDLLDVQSEQGLSAAPIEVEDAGLWTPTFGTQAVQSIDGFRRFNTNDYHFGLICTHHALSDVYAMGAKPKHVQAWINLEFAHPRIQQRDHLRMLRGVVDALRESQVELLGGHSSQGAESHLGLVANGELPLGGAWLKGGVRAGDLILLSKPLGSGVILAADMQGEAPAATVEAAEQIMRESNLEAYRQLLCGKPSAVTDITGFGLIGHLLESLEMVADSGHSATDASGDKNPQKLQAAINLNAVPAISGALELLHQGWRSSLQPQLKGYLNRCQLDSGLRGRHLRVVELLLDPQTSGGLMVCMDRVQAQDLLKDGSAYVAIGRIDAVEEGLPVRLGSNIDLGK